MIPALSLLALAAAVQADPAVPSLDGLKPDFGFACHSDLAGQVASFRYFVFLPDRQAIGDPQRAVVRLVDGEPTTLPLKELTLEGMLMGISVPPPPPSAKPTPPLRMASVSGESADKRARFRGMIVATTVVKADGPATLAFRPGKGSLALTDASGKTSTLAVECDDISGRAAPTN